MNKDKTLELDVKILVYNVLLYFLSIFLILLGIQHATFFYQLPPDLRLWVDVPVWTYPFLGAVVYLLLKISYFIEEQGKLFKVVPPVEELEQEEN